MLRLIALALTLLAAPITAQSSDANAVGRVELGNAGFCTGTLIAPDIVLTAAHCLYDKYSGARFDAGQLTFRAGYKNGNSIAQRGVRRAVAHSQYRASSAGQITNLMFDIALLQLDRPLPTSSVVPMKVAALDLSGRSVGVMSYGRDRSETLTFQESCAISARPEGVFVTTCQASFGTSGAPVVQVRHGEPRVVSLVSAMARADGRPVAIATDVAATLSELRARLKAAEFTALH